MAAQRSAAAFAQGIRGQILVRYVVLLYPHILVCVYVLVYSYCEYLWPVSIHYLYAIYSSTRKIYVSVLARWDGGTARPYRLCNRTGQPRRVRIDMRSGIACMAYGCEQRRVQCARVLRTDTCVDFAPKDITIARAGSTQSCSSDIIIRVSTRACVQYGRYFRRPTHLPAAKRRKVSQIEDETIVRPGLGDVCSSFEKMKIYCECVKTA